MNIKEDICKTIFREYDIRGEYLSQIDEDTAYTIGLAVGTKLRSMNKTDCVVGHDNRLSAEVLTNALLQGLYETGIDVTYVGLVTTPMYYYACIKSELGTGVMVTASHNPVNDNGFKIMLENNQSAVGEQIKELYDIACSKKFASGKGLITKLEIKESYVNEITRDIKIDKPLKVVIDPANATTSIVVHEIFDRLPIKPVYINAYSDGSFPSHHPDPSVPENMKQISEKVVNSYADIGLAFDGDGDRLGVVDENGNIISVDTLMAIVWDDLMPKVDNKTAMYDVKCSKLLEDEITKIGGTPYIYRTGGAYLRNKAAELDLAFAGELSGHMVFRDRYYGYDDGIYAGLRLLEILGSTDKKASELYAGFNKYYSTPEIKFAVNEKQKFAIVDKVKKYCTEKKYDIITVDGVRVRYPDGWALVRASNTGPNITTRFEAKDENRLKEIEKEYTDLINKLNV